MPKIYRVKKAQRNQGQCGNFSCSAVIEKGDPYIWWQFAYSTKSKRCISCHPKPSEMTNSEFYASVLSTQEALDAELEQNDGIESIIAAYCIAAESMTQIGEETYDKQSSLEEHFPGGSPTITLLEERVEWCNDVSAELEGASSECCDIIEDCEDCEGTGEISVDSEGEATVQQPAGKKTCQDCDGSGKEEETEAKIEEALDHGMGIDWGGMA